TVPFGREDVEGLSVGAAERAGEPAAVEVDCVEDVAAFAYADAALVRHVGVPDGFFGVDADAVGHSVAEFGPDATVGQAAVVGDLVGGQLLGVGLADDERWVVGGYRHAVGKGEPVGDLPGGPVRGDQHDTARRV